MARGVCNVGGIRNDLVFKLDGTRTTTALTTILVNRNVVVRGKRQLLGSSILGNAIIVVLFAYVVDSIIARHTTHGVIARRGLVRNDRNGRRRHVLVPMTGPRAVRKLMNVTLVVERPGRGRSLITLDIVGSGGASRAGRLVNGHGLRHATVVTTTTSTSMGAILHCSLGVTRNVVRARGRCTMASVMVNLRHGAGLVSSFFNAVARGLLGNAGHRVVVTGLLVPIGALHQVIITIPSGTRCRGNFLG